jgi:hypothetical protein
VFGFAYKPRFGEKKREMHGFFSPSQKLKDWRRRSEGDEWELIKISRMNLTYILKST